MNKKVIIYNRRPSTEDDTTYVKIKEEMRKRVVDECKDKIVACFFDHNINRREEQEQYKEMVRVIRNKEIEWDWVICYDLYHLINEPFPDAMGELMKLNYICGGRFHLMDYLSNPVFEVVSVCEWVKGFMRQRREGAALLALKDGSVKGKVGRPGVMVDVAELIKMREREMSYSQIAKQLQVSVATVYNRMPEGMKTRARKRLSKRMRQVLSLTQTDIKIGEEEEGEFEGRRDE